MGNNFRHSFGSGLAFGLAIFLAVAGPAAAALPEPDNVIYGSITLDSVPVTAARTDVVIEARRLTNGPAIASYRMGSDPQLGNFYALSLLLEALPPVSAADVSQIGEPLVITLLDATGVRGQTSFTIAERGQVQRIDFGLAQIDGDGDGLPDAWELRYFPDLSRSSASPGVNGQSVLQNFIAGTDPTDPDDGFRLYLGASNSQQQVSFVAKRAEGPGYEGMTRLYTLESASEFSVAGWTGVTNFIDLAGDNQTVVYTTSTQGPPEFFRGKIVLQGFTLPGAADLDNDMLPDSWEMEHFGDLTRDASFISANGRTALENYVAGTDPQDADSGLRLVIVSSNGEPSISLMGLMAQGAGYENKTRFYAVEKQNELLGSWSSVPGFSSVAASNQLIVIPPQEISPGFYRARTWLEPAAQ